MNYKQYHITELFKQYAGLQQQLFSRPGAVQQQTAKRFLKELLDRFHRKNRCVYSVEGFT